MPAADHVEELDAIVIGANIRGLVTTHVLDRLGFRAALIDRAPRAGGADGSFSTPTGARFDFGLHVLDEMRSPVATRLFESAVGGAVHRVPLRRAIALRGRVLPYAPWPQDLPDDLRSLLPPGDLADDLGDDLPTRERLARCYGEGYTAMILDEVLPSFPSENRHRAFGVDESRLLANIYPWFFPRVAERAPSRNESRAFHDRLRAGIPQTVLYPRSGSFSGFAEGLLAGFHRDRIEVLLGAGELRFEVDPRRHRLRAVEAAGRRLAAGCWFWAASWLELCRLLGIDWPDPASDRVLLGSFVLDRPPLGDFHEILVGDPDLRINRAHFPGRIRQSGEPLMQVEFAVPIAEDWPADADYWRQRWLQDAARLSLLDPASRVVDFDFKAVAMHFNAFGVEGRPLRDADPRVLAPETNIHPVAPSLANLNLNSHVPRTIREVSAVLADLKPRPEDGH